MEYTVAIHVPREWLKDVPEEESTLRQIFKLGLDQYKVERALALYRSEAGSLGYIT
jgi:hypothetical protein